MKAGYVTKHAMTMVPIPEAILRRPALTQLLDDITDGKIQVVVVYKVDRLTRNLADFAKLIELFDKHEVSFVSVTPTIQHNKLNGKINTECPALFRSI